MSLSGNDAANLPRTGISSSNRTSYTPAPKKKKKKFKIDIRNMGVNIDKNEYYEIKLSNSAHPERGL